MRAEVTEGRQRNLAGTDPVSIRAGAKVDDAASSSPDQEARLACTGAPPAAT
jgi:hypothetical protein